MKPRTNLLEELRSSRKAIIELLVVIVFLSLALNLFSSALYDLVRGGSAPGQSPLRACALWGGVSILLFFVTAWYFLRRKWSHTLYLQIVLPLSEAGEHPCILRINGYAPTSRGAEILHSYLKHHHKEIKTVRDFCRKQGDNSFILLPLYHLAVTLFIVIVNKHATHTTTRQGDYHLRYKDRRWDIATNSHSLKEFPFYLANVTHFPKKLILPKEISIKTSPAQLDDTLVITLDCPYCSLDFEILPHWTEFTRKKSLKNYLIATRNLDIPKYFRLLAIPVKVTVTAKFHSLYQRKADQYCAWMEDLLSETIRWLSWQHFKENDQHRLIVEMHEKIDALFGKEEEAPSIPPARPDTR